MGVDRQNYTRGLTAAGEAVRDLLAHLPEHGTQYDKGQRRACIRIEAAIKRLLDEAGAPAG